MAILEAIRIPGYKKEEIMKQYNIGKTAFYSIIQQKDKLYQDMSPARSSKTSRALPAQQKELESRIIRWLSEKERKGMLVGGQIHKLGIWNHFTNPTLTTIPRFPV